MNGIIKNRYGQTLGVVNSKAKIFKNGNRGFVGFARMNDPETGKGYSVYLQLVELRTRPAKEANAGKHIEEKGGDAHEVK